MKQRNSFVFLLFNLILVLILAQVHNFFKDYFGEVPELTSRNQRLVRDVEREKLHADLVRQQLWDLQQDVAQILPMRNLADLKVKTQKDYRLMELAQTLRAPASQTQLNLSGQMMEQGHQEFKKGNYKASAAIFKDVIQKFPASSQVIEAYFLMGESEFQAGRYEECLDTVHVMLSQFPENEMTGFLLMRNAEILQKYKRGEEAVEVYRMIANEFVNHPGLRAQARRLASVGER